MSHGLAERLVTEGLAKREDVELALENAPRGGRSLAEMLVEMGAGDVFVVETPGGDAGLLAGLLEWAAVAPRARGA